MLAAEDARNESWPVLPISAVIRSSSNASGSSSSAPTAESKERRVSAVLEGAGFPEA